LHLTVEYRQELLSAKPSQFVDFFLQIRQKSPSMSTVHLRVMEPEGWERREVIGLIGRQKAVDQRPRVLDQIHHNRMIMLQAVLRRLMP